MIDPSQVGAAGIFLAGAGAAVRLLYPLMKNGKGGDLNHLYDLHRETNLILRGISELLTKQGASLEQIGERLVEHDHTARRAIENLLQKRP